MVALRENNPPSLFFLYYIERVPIVTVYHDGGHNV
jgi:hypothetical protein